MRPPAKTLIASAIGFNAERGDTLTLRSLQMERPDVVDLTPVEAGWSLSGNLDAMALAQLGFATVVALVLALFVIRPALLSTRAIAPQKALLDESGPGLPETSLAGIQADQVGSLGAAIGTGAQTQLPGGTSAPMEPLHPIDMPEMAVGEFAFPDPTPLPPPPPIPVDAEAVARLRGLITERREETLEVLRSWMETVDDRDGEAAR